MGLGRTTPTFLKRWGGGATAPLLLTPVQWKVRQAGDLINAHYQSIVTGRGFNKAHHQSACYRQGI